MLASTVARVASRRASASAARRLHSTPVSRGAGGYDYLHDEYMYKLRFKPASKVKAGALISLGVGLGVGIPLFAVEFNQRKAGLK